MASLSVAAMASIAASQQPAGKKAQGATSGAEDAADDKSLLVVPVSSSFGAARAFDCNVSPATGDAGATTAFHNTQRLVDDYLGNGKPSGWVALKTDIRQILMACDAPYFGKSTPVKLQSAKYVPDPTGHGLTFAGILLHLHPVDKTRSELDSHRWSILLAAAFTPTLGPVAGMSWAATKSLGVTFGAVAPLRQSLPNAENIGAEASDSNESDFKRRPAIGVFGGVTYTFAAPGGGGKN
jgi:hypothetical protein